MKIIILNRQDRVDLNTGLLKRSQLMLQINLTTAGMWNLISFL